MIKPVSSFRLLLTFVVLTSLLPGLAMAKQVKNIRIWHSPDNTRIVFDVTAPVKYKVFTLQNPLRVVVDIEQATLSGTVPKLNPANEYIRNIRSGAPASAPLRFVFELKKALKTNSFLLTPNELYGNRLVVDLEDQVGSPTADQADAILADPQQQTTAALAPTKPKQLLIAIDAGHGGEDPGAKGYRGSYEKHVTLSIANKLKSLIDNNSTMASHMVRKGDYFIKLHKRRESARRVNADMFISIHADAFKRSSASGFSVFALSQRGATSAMARALAQKENAADLIGGVSLSDKDEVLQKVLVDLSMNNTVSESLNFGSRLIKQLSRLGKLHSHRVEQAGFAVLKSADIPSVLIETGFITNPSEEKKLRSNSYQDQLANAIYRAIVEYYQQTPHKVNSYYASSMVSNSGKPQSIQAATRKTIYHKVVRGDSLSKISEKYNVKIGAIKSANKLKRDTVMLGEKLKIPGAKTRTNSKASSKKGAYHLHKVKRGDTLSDIANKYGTSMSKIIQLNKMRSRMVMLGQTLKVPY